MNTQHGNEMKDGTESRDSEKWAVVTAAGGGMGTEIAKALTAAGFYVISCDINMDSAKKTADSVQGKSFKLDVRSEDDWNSLAHYIKSKKKNVNLLVNNAGILDYAPIVDTTLDSWTTVLDTNLTGSFLGIKHLAPLMMEYGGSIVNISSAAGMTGAGNLGSYSSSKWGLRGLTKTAALELAPFNIRVNSVHPGIIDTELSQLIPESYMKKIQLIPRKGTVSEVAELVVFLSTNASYSTGCEFVLDGGYLTGRLP